MEACFRPLVHLAESRIVLVWNQHDPDIVPVRVTTRNIKYKKVSESKRQRLIERVLVHRESTIKVASELGINYSTAKSIIMKDKNIRKAQLRAARKEEQHKCIASA